MEYIGYNEGHYSTEYSAYGNTRNPGDDETVQADRRRNLPDFGHAHKQYPEPYRVETQRKNRRENNGNGKGQRRHYFQEAADNDIKNQYHYEDSVRWQIEPCYCLGQNERKVGYRQKSHENKRTDDDDEYHGCRLAGLV